MKKLIFVIVLLITPILAQCDWNGDGVVDVLDIFSTVDCIMSGCWDGTQCDWNDDGIINILDIIQTVDCFLDNGPCPEFPVYGCTDSDALNYNPDATIDDGSCEYNCSDIDGNVYDTVIIGGQEWMAGNLKTTHYGNGDPIPTGYSNSEWPGLSTGAYGIYNNDPTNAEVYGNLYNWYAVDDTRDICPEGWHVPTDAEWTELTNYLGSNAGGKLKEAGTSHWNSPNLGANNESGFTALPGGYRHNGSGNYGSMGNYGVFWSSTVFSSDIAWMRHLNYNSIELGRDYNVKRNGVSIRCVGD